MQTRYHVMFLALIAALLFVLFHLFGNTVESVHSRSVFAWMVARWGDSISYGADYSIGWLIPFVSLGILWWRRRDLAQAVEGPAWGAFAFVVIGLLLHWAGARIQQPRISLVGLVTLLWGIPFLLWGWKLAKLLIFPCAYLLFCIPMNFLDAMTFPLRMLATATSTTVLNGLGFAATRSGSAIFMSSGSGFQFDVADPCSGLRSLMAMMALIAVYAYITPHSTLKKWVLFLLAIPIAILGNVVRITTVAMVAVIVSKDAASVVYHDFSGYVIFVAAVLLTLGAERALRINYPQVIRKWAAPA